MSNNTYFRGFDDFVRTLKELEADVERTIIGVIDEATNTGMAESIKETPTGIYEKEVFFMTRKGEQVHFKVKNPKQGGTLKKGWHHQPAKRKGKGYFGGYSNNIEYGLYVNYGHRIVRNDITIGYSPGFFFLEAGVQQMQEQYRRIFEQKLKAIKEKRGL